MLSADGATRAATLSDVARLAGVSIATASKALNGRGDVAALTRQRVREAADSLAFTPNAMARGLLAGRTGTGRPVVEAAGEVLVGRRGELVVGRCELIGIPHEVGVRVAGRGRRGHLSRVSAAADAAARRTVRCEPRGRTVAS
jgi:hypothetical protein